MSDEKDVLKKPDEEKKTETPDLAPCDAIYEPIEKECEKETDDVKKPYGMTNGNSFVTKSEGMIMLCASLAVLLICNMGVNIKLNNLNQQLIDNHEDIEYKLDIAETKIETLEQTLIDLTDDLEQAIDTLNKKPINITISNGEATLTPDVEQDGEVTEPIFDTRPFLGVGFNDIETVVPNAPGLKVDVVYEFSPAEFAGLKVGDYIVAINGVNIRKYEDLSTVMDNCKAEDVIQLDYLTVTENGIEQKTANVTLTFRGNFDLEN